MSRKIPALVLLATVSLTGCSMPKPAAPSPTDFDVSGSLTVPGQISVEQKCETTGGYVDIKTGAQVEVQDGAGKTLAIGNLGDAKFKNTTTCVFAFTVPDVPEGQNIYAIAIGNSQRGSLKYTRDQLGQPVDLVIGG